MSRLWLRNWAAYITRVIREISQICLFDKVNWIFHQVVSIRPQSWLTVVKRKKKTNEHVDNIEILFPIMESHCTVQSVMSAIYKQQQKKCASLVSCTIIAKICTEIIHIFCFFDVFIESMTITYGFIMWVIRFSSFFSCVPLHNVANTIGSNFSPPNKLILFGIEIAIIAKAERERNIKRKSNHKIWVTCVGCWEWTIFGRILLMIDILVEVLLVADTHIYEQTVAACSFANYGPSCDFKIYYPIMWSHRSYIYILMKCTWFIGDVPTVNYRTDKPYTRNLQSIIVHYRPDDVIRWHHRGTKPLNNFKNKNAHIARTWICLIIL